MPVSIDRQIEQLTNRMKADRQKFQELKKKKQEMILKKNSTNHKKEIAKLIKENKSTEEILEKLK